MPLTAADIMTPSVATCTVDVSLKQAALLMAEEDCGALPVLDDTTAKPVGIITDRDIACRAVANGLDPEITTVAACMTVPVVCVDRGASVEECARRLAERQIRRLLVLDADGACCGIIAQADLARSMPAAQAGDVLRQVSEPSLTSA